MKSLVTFFLLFMTLVATSQVGINTDTPDPSSILEIYSETQGLLTPRMTSAQRIAIASPATGLMVFDIDLNSFQFYDGSDWTYLGDIPYRENYKLVKDISDLSEELTAGGGTSYLLNTDYLYEISGTITFDFPINLNGAYIEGVDSSGDILVHGFTGGSLFEGAGGGGLRNLTLSGNANQLFDIKGTAADLLLINNTIFASASKVGTMSGLGTVFLSVTQYLGNDDGLSVSNINSFFVSNIFWPSSNTGTFLELSGTFQNLQMNGGRVEADTGEIGIDVSSNPSIVNDATLAQLSFVGNGTAVESYTTESYTGFNFTNDWNVNCSGIPTESDQVAAANFYFNGDLTSGFGQTISKGTAVQVKSSADFVTSGLFRFAAADNNNDLIYDGNKTRNIQVNVSLSIRVTSAANDFYAFAIAKNGVIATETNSIVIIADDNQIQNVALNGVLTVSPGDRIEVFTRRLTGSGSDSLIVFSENLSVR